jgi:site-specific DNA recombinase
MGVTSKELEEVLEIAKYKDRKSVKDGAQPEAVVCGYYRVSKAREDMIAPEIYEEEIRRGVEYRRGPNGEKLVLKKMFHDIDYSGRRGSKTRPGLEEMKARCLAGEFEAVIVPKLTRLGRSMADLAQLYAMFDDANVGLIFLDVDIDSRTSSGRLVRNIMSTLAEYESDLQSDRWRDTHRYKAAKGEASGMAPYGYVYDKDNKTLKVDPEQAAVVKQIFKWYASGNGIREICLRLNAEGIDPGQSRPHQGQTGWWHTRIAYMLKNPAYLGVKMPRHAKDYDGSVFDASWPAIIDLELYNAVKKQRELSAARGPGKRTSVIHLLSGLLKCSLCGSTMTRQVGGKTSPNRYQCPRHFNMNGGNQERCLMGSVSEDRAVRLISDAFLDHVRSGVKVASAREKAPPQRSIPRTDSQKELTSLRSELSRIVDRVLAVDSPSIRSELNRRAIAIEERIRELDIEEKALASAQASYGTRRESYIETMALSKDVDELWERADIDRKRRLLFSVVEKVEVLPGRPKQLRIMWKQFKDTGRFEPTTVE